MKTYFLNLIIIILGLSNYGLAQNKVSLNGKVLDNSGTPLENTHIILNGTNYGTYTDIKGNFNFKQIPAGQYLLIASNVGYLPVKQDINLSQSVVDVNISLKVDPFVLPQLYVINSRDGLFTKIPGSVSYLNRTEINRLSPISGNEVFRRVPGLNVVDEEGVGLRANIGIRGLDPDRSRSVLVLEDGIPIALNPYGEPELYYTPAIDRMEGVEVLKGSGQIMYGPQTIGGVINYITAEPPAEQEVGFKLIGGQGAFMSALASYGNTFNNTGVQVNYLRKQADAIGATNFSINDFNTKLRIPLAERSTLGIKISAYNEASNSTYVGITQAMYDRGGDDFSVLVPNDELDVSRYSLSFTHKQELSERVTLQSSLFGYTTSRNWRRQDYAYNTFNNGVLNQPPADWTGVVWGDESMPGGAIYLRNRTGNRDRQFEVVGWEQKLVLNTSIANIHNEIISGYRYLYERAYEQRINGTSADALSGALVSDEIRTGKAFSFFVLDKISLSDKLEFTPGIRAEFYQYEREILREASQDVYKIAENNIAEIIPGMGINWRPLNQLNFFSGVHRGYAPPRIKDAIDFTFENPVLQLEAERSWNYELGLRSNFKHGISAELTYFYMDFDNQIIPSSQSSGGVGFGFTNAGRTLHQGIEASFQIRNKEILSSNWKAGFDINTTYVSAKFNADQFLTLAGEQVNIRGNRLPYAPEWTISSAITIESPYGTGLRITNNYVGEQFGDQLNTVLPSNNGRIGLIDSYNLIDANLYHRVPKWNTVFNISVKNLTNERYIASRRPEGIRVGIPRLITAGIDFKI
jgi:Fe(3+) dicitrate transport protein